MTPVRLILLVFETVASMKDHLTDKQICGSYVGGQGIPAIARSIGRSQFYVWSRLKSHGIQRRQSGNPDKKRPYRQAAKELVEAAIARYVAGESAKSIASDGWINKRALLQALREHAIKIRFQAICTDDQIIEAYQSGKSGKTIEKELGGSRRRVAYVLKNAGISFRTRTREKTTACRARWTKKRTDTIGRATTAWADRKAMRALYKKASALSKATGIVHHVDHFYPLQHHLVCGLHVEGNLSIVTASANCKKNNYVSEAMLQWA